jgi:hypothetical protein
MLTVSELLKREDFFDSAILRHGFVDYMRDYEIIVSGRDGPPRNDVHRYLFIGCVEATYEIAIAPQHVTSSLADEFVFAGPDKPEPDGFIWGVRWASAYPGTTYVDNGAGARKWSALLERPMHEVLVKTNAYSLRLIFADLRHQYLGLLDSPGVLRAKDYPIPPNPNDMTSDGNVQ